MMPTRTLGKSGVELSILGFGSAPIGNIFAAVSEEDAAAAMDTAYVGGVRYFDTAPMYGHGLAENRMGSALWRYQDPQMVLSTKVGYTIEPARGRPLNGGSFKDIPPFVRSHDYTYDATMRQIESSMHRLRTDRFDILLIHDCDTWGHGDRLDERFKEAMEGAYKALHGLREQGVIRAIGCGLNEWQASERFARAGDFDCFLLAGRYTLLDQESLRSFLPLCQERNIGIILGSPYNSGILATKDRANSYFHYNRATPEMIARVDRIEAICESHSVPLKAAALQFPLLHPSVTCIIPGGRTAAEVGDNFAMLDHSIPYSLWSELIAEGLIDPRSPIAAGNA